MVEARVRVGWEGDLGVRRVDVHNISEKGIVKRRSRTFIVGGGLIMEVRLGSFFLE